MKNEKKLRLVTRETLEMNLARELGYETRESRDPALHGASASGLAVVSASGLAVV